MYSLDHSGIAVTDLEASIATYQDLFGFKVSFREENTAHKVRLAFLELANTSLELLQGTGPESTISKFVSSRGPGLHHLCFKVDDISTELKKLKLQGVRLIDEVARPGARNTLIAFLHPKSTDGVLYELCQYT